MNESFTSFYSDLECLPKETPAPPVQQNKRLGYIKKQIERSRKKLSEVKAKEERKEFMKNKGKEKEVVDVDQLVSDDDGEDKENREESENENENDREDVDQLINDGEGEQPEHHEGVKTRGMRATALEHRKENVVKKKSVAGIALEDLLRKIGRNKNKNKFKRYVEVIPSPEDQSPDVDGEADGEGDTDVDEEGEEEEGGYQYQRESIENGEERGALNMIEQGDLVNLADTNESAPLVQNGIAMSGSGNWHGGLDDFKRDAAAETLPAVSYYIGPAELSEHPPNLPRDGGWLWKEIVDAVVSSPKYNKTVLLISFDETGGWGDHVVPFHSILSQTTSPLLGPGYRLPFVVVSPWTRGGNVFTEPSDHISQILFLEEWAAAHGTPFRSAEINDWRREHMSNLTNMFDWEHPDVSPVTLPFAEVPHSDLLTSLLDGPTNCERLFDGSIQPPIPYGNQTEEDALVTEQGFKSVRGSLTEGRFLVFESGDSAIALSSDNTTLGTANVSETKFDEPSQRFVVYATDPSDASAKTFKISAGADLQGNSTMYVNSDLGFGEKDDGAVFSVTFNGVSSGYVFEETESGKVLGIEDESVALGDSQTGFKLFSVTF
ncbi:hypothetical protein K435DRAFT_838374 [Dendrothele bispora CBS 962.96]|uniref:Phosphoesterase-domain-containing protein n=2 Tax=Dendrothele bispora (strain CBS 962.96) TaxID=1314807 RepID=A0A4S8M6F4_DENBC|nr:hypothetical protein K435DRAFT_838374 [Dendrothele bispora CBS 962.96]